MARPNDVNYLRALMAHERALELASALDQARRSGIDPGAAADDLGLSLVALEMLMRRHEHRDQARWLGAEISRRRRARDRERASTPKKDS